MRPSKPPLRSDLMALMAAAPPPPVISTVVVIATCPGLSGGDAGPPPSPAASRHLDLRQLVPQPVAEGAALRALGEDALLLERPPEDLVGLAVPELAERRLPDVAEGDIDRARVHVAVGIDAGGL